MEGEGSLMIGTLKSWKEAWGFIVCPEAFEGDLFAHKDNFSNKEVGFPQGDLAGATVTFERTVDVRGRGTATNIEVLKMVDGSDPVLAPTVHTGRSGGGKGGFPTTNPQFSSMVVGGKGQGGVMQFQSPSMMGGGCMGGGCMGGGGMGGGMVMGGSMGGGCWSGGGMSQGGGGGAASQAANPQALAPFVGQRVIGTCRSWRGDWGFAQCTQKFAGDIFMHRQNVQTNCEPTSGSAIEFTVSIDGRGRGTALEVRDAQGAVDAAQLGNPAAQEMVGGGRVRGTIRSWRKDWGFVVCPDFFAGDVFCHQDSLQPGTAEVYGNLEQALPGATVELEVATDKRGRPCAQNVEVLSPGNGDGGFGGCGAQVKVEGGLQHAVSGLQQPVPMRAMGQPRGPSGEAVTGTIRSWRDPWGFVVSPSFEGDLFCHMSSFSTPPPPGVNLTGATVQFRRAMDGKGRYRAQEVHLLDCPAPDQHIAQVPQMAAAAHGGAVFMDPTGTVDAGGFASVVPGGGMSAAAVPDTRFAHLDQEQYGLVRSWRDDWGFIISPEVFEGDLFCHRDNLVPGTEFLAQGASVSFRITPDQRGRSTATNLKVLNESGDWAGSGQHLVGKVRSFRQGEPWGFITSPGSYTGDLFFHAASMANPAHQVMLAPGLDVTFKVELDGSGRCKAMEITPYIKQDSKRPPQMGGSVQPMMKRVRQM